MILALACCPIFFTWLISFNYVDIPFLPSYLKLKMETKNFNHEKLFLANLLPNCSTFSSNLFLIKDLSASSYPFFCCFFPLQVHLRQKKKKQQGKKKNNFSDIEKTRKISHAINYMMESSSSKQ